MHMQISIKHLRQKKKKKKLTTHTGHTLTYQHNTIIMDLEVILRNCP